jgi:signal peptidase II
MNPRTRLGVILFVLVLIADQASKQWILHGLELGVLGRVELLPVLELVMVWNHGVTFGIFNGSGGLVAPLILGAVALAIVAGLFVWLRRAENFWVAAALGAIAGGAVGNVIDRIRYGAVVDFVHLHLGNFDPFPYIFNIGDSAIVCGVIALLIDGMWPSQKGGNSGKQSV